jgi:PAS domain S-box-containing protein
LQRSRRIDGALSREERERLLAGVAFEEWTWEWSFATGEVTWGRGSAEMFGYLPDELGDVAWWKDHVHPDDLARVLRTVDEALATSAPGWSSEYRFRRKDGFWAWVAGCAVIQRDVDGRPVRSVGTMTDVSHLKQVRDWLRLFTEQLPARACAIDRDLRVVLDVGGGFSEHLSAVGKTVPELFATSPDRDRVLDGCRRALAGESCKLDLDDGTTAAQLELTPFRDVDCNVIGVVGLSLDVTERKRAEAKAQETQRLLQLVLDTLPVGLQVMDRAGNIITTNPASRGIWGDVIVSGQERYQRGVGFWHDSGKRIEREEWVSQRALNMGETSLNELIEIVSFDDQHKTIRNSAAPIRDEQGQIVGAVVVIEDVTEQARAQDALRKSQRLLVEAESLGRIGSWEQDLVTGEILGTEENRRLFFGEDRSKGAHIEDYAAAVHPDDRARVMSERERLLAEGSPRDIEFRVVWPDGSVHVLFGRITVVRDASGRAIRLYGTNADISERKRAEEELDRRLSQQAAVAQLGQDALRGGDLQALFDEALDLIARSSGVDFGEIAELLPDDTLLLRAALGWKEGIVGRARFPANSGSPCARAMASGAPSIVDECERETRFSVDTLILEQGIVSHVTVLIKGEGRPFGTLSAGTKARRKFTDHDINFLQSMANVLAAALEQKRAVRELDEKGDRLEALSRRLLDAQEAERRAIARELHDDFGAMLSALKLNLQNEKRGADAVAENLALVDQAIQQVRDLASDLRPSILDDLGLAAAVNWYADREARRAGLDLRLDTESIDGKLPATVETACFRIVQEALTNVVRHSGAKSIEVQLHARADAVRVCVRDDGKGFDVDTVRRAAAAGRSHGLLNMQERAELAGGQLEIESGPGLGTTICATFRVSQERDR